MADRLHPSFPEDPDVFTERLRLYPAGVRVLDCDGTACGYLISHPWRSGTVPALNTLLRHLPADADMYYLHDLALLPSTRGTGAARLIVEEMAEHARAKGYPVMGLVAVNGSVPFWRRCGFAVAEHAAMAETLASYEEAARLMIRDLGSRRMMRPSL